MKNILNLKNNSISNYSKQTIDIKDDNVNIIPSRSIMNENITKKISSKINSKKNKNNKKKSKNSKKSKKSIKTITQKRITYTNIKDKFEFPHGEKYKCISPCYPADTLYYHPLTLQGIKNNFDSCSTRLNNIDNEIISYDKCKINPNFDFDNYDMFADIFQVATTDDDFLKQIYNIKNIYDVELFLENNINQLPLFSQIRILKCIFHVYRDNDAFPSKNFIENTKKILKNKYNKKMKSDKILNKILSDKHLTNVNNLFEILLK